jgi:hypothetical protein
MGMEEVYSQSGCTLEKVSAAPVPRKEKRKVKTAKELTELDPMLASPKGFRARVLDLGFIIIGSKSQPGKQLVMCNYDCVTENGLLIQASCFLCVEYSGFALQQAANWFKRRGEFNFPRNAEAARSFCWGLPTPREVTIKKNGKYLNVDVEHF